MSNDYFIKNYYYNNEEINSSSNVAINTIGLYISQAFNNLDYNNVINLYSECLQSILHSILNYNDDSQINENINSLINNETNIHTIIMYAIQMIKEKSLNNSPITVIDCKSLTTEINNIQNVREILPLVRKRKKWLYLNCNFRNFLVRIIQINIDDLNENLDLKSSLLFWINIYSEILNNFNYNGDNIYLINTIWYQQLRIIFRLYTLLNMEMFYMKDDDNDESIHRLKQKQKEEIQMFRSQIQQLENELLVNKNDDNKNEKNLEYKLRETTCEINDLKNKVENLMTQLENVSSENEMLITKINENEKNIQLEKDRKTANIVLEKKNLTEKMENIREVNDDLLRENRNIQEMFKTENEKLQNENERLRKEIYEKDLENRNLNINLGELQKNIETNLSINNSLKADFEKKINEYELTLHKTIESHDIKDKTLTKEIDNLQLHISQINKQNILLDQELAQIKNKYEEKVNELLNYRLRSDSIANQDRQSLTDTIQLLNQQLSDYKNTNINYTEEMYRLNSINSENDTKVKLKEAQIKELETKLNELEERNITIKNNLDDINTSYYQNIYQKLILFCQKREIQLQNCNKKKPEELLNFVIQIAEEKYDIELNNKKLKRKLSIYKKSIYDTYDILSNFFNTFEYNRIILQELQQPKSSMELEIRTLLEENKREEQPMQFLQDVDREEMNLLAIEQKGMEEEEDDDEEEKRIKKISIYVKYMEYLLNTKYKITENILEVFTKFTNTIIEMLNITFENITNVVVSPVDILHNTCNNIIKEIEKMQAINQSLQSNIVTKSNELETIINEKSVGIQKLIEIFTLCISEFKVIFNLIVSRYYNELPTDKEKIIQDIAIIEQKNEIIIQHPELLNVEEFKIVISKISEFIKSSFNYLLTEQQEKNNTLNYDISHLKESLYRYETNFSDIINYLKSIIDDNFYKMDSKEVMMTDDVNKDNIKYYIDSIIYSKDKYCQQLCYEKCTQLFGKILNIFGSSSNNNDSIQTAFNDCDEAINHYSNVITTIYDDKNESYKRNLKLYYANLLDVQQLLLEGDDDKNILSLLNRREEEEEDQHQTFVVLFDEIKTRLYSWMKITNSIREKEIALYDMIQMIKEKEQQQQKSVSLLDDEPQQIMKYF